MVLFTNVYHKYQSITGSFVRNRGEFFLFCQFVVVSSCQLRQDEKETQRKAKVGKTASLSNEPCFTGNLLELLT